MIDIVKKFFGKMIKDDDTEENSKSAHDIHIAACALLLEMSKIDDEFSAPEQKRVVSAMKEKYNLSSRDVQEIMEKSDKELEGSLDLWQFTSLINKNYSMEEKLGIIETVWGIAYADGKLDKHEDYLMHKLASLLRLTHRQLMETKCAAIERINLPEEAR